MRDCPEGLEAEAPIRRWRSGALSKRGLQGRHQPSNRGRLSHVVPCTAEGDPESSHHTPGRERAWRTSADKLGLLWCWTAISAGCGCSVTAIWSSASRAVRCARSALPCGGLRPAWPASYVCSWRQADLATRLLRCPLIGVERKSYARMESFRSDRKPASKAGLIGRRCARRAIGGTGTACPDAVPRLTACPGRSAARHPAAVVTNVARGALQNRDRREGGVWNGPRKSGLPDLRTSRRRSRVNPRSMSAAHHWHTSVGGIPRASRDIRFWAAIEG